MDELIGGLIIVSLIFWVYFAPSILAFHRKVPSPWSIVVINALLGWTLIGWAVALALAARSVPKPSEDVVAAPAADPVDGVRRLAELHGKGVITDEEFTTAKTRLLSGY